MLRSWLDGWLPARLSAYMYTFYLALSVHYYIRMICFTVKKVYRFILQVTRYPGAKHLFLIDIRQAQLRCTRYTTRSTTEYTQQVLETSGYGSSDTGYK